jgi:TonB family protein
MAVDEQLKLSTDGVCRIGEPMAGAEQPGAYDPPEKARGTASPAGDVWSLGMILTEALTQRLPVWESAGQGEPALPATLPGSFADMVRNCLRRDPQRRWTVAEIVARLRQTTPTPQKPATVESRKTTGQWRLIFPLVAAGLVLVAILAGSRLLHPGQETEPGASSVAEQPRPEPQPEQMAEQKGLQSQTSSGTPGPAQSAASTKNNTDRVQGEVVEQVLPNVSPSARATITGRVKVRVRVQVDAAGNVTAADFESPGPSKYFARLALQAAQRWKFAPSDVAGDVPRKWILRFEFGRAGTKAFPSKAVP